MLNLFLLLGPLPILLSVLNCLQDLLFTGHILALADLEGRDILQVLLYLLGCVCFFCGGLLVKETASRVLLAVMGADLR